MIELRLPSFGADMDDAEFIRWNVQPGQPVNKGDIACVVETQKGAIDVEVWQAGTVARLLAEPGQRLPVGHLLAVLAGEGEDWHAVAATTAVPGSTAIGRPSLSGSTRAPLSVTTAPVRSGTSTITLPTFVSSWATCVAASSRVGAYFGSVSARFADSRIVSASSS